MSAAEILGIGNEAILVALRIGAPVMLLALAVGLAISVLQALTQIQEMTLTFVPKILVIMLSLLVLLPVMLGTLTSFTQSLFQRMAAG
jgi:flagellar biosynthetic protein FliQ